MCSVAAIPFRHGDSYFKDITLSVRTQMPFHNDLCHTGLITLDDLLLHSFEISDNYIRRQQFSFQMVKIRF